MTVTANNNEPKLIRFNDVEIGDIFKWYDRVCVKTSYSFSVDTNAFDLSNRETDFFDEDELVQVINAKIIIESC